MLSTTSGRRASVISASDSCISESPCPVEPVAAGTPVAAAPHAMPTASSSLSAFMHTPPTAGSLRGHVLEHLGERRHRVAGEEPAAGGDHRLGDRLGAFEQRRRSCRRPPRRPRGLCRTCRPGTRSRGRSASTPCSRCTRRAGAGSGSRARSPRASVITSTRGGQASMQRSQPLHASTSITTVPRVEHRRHQATAPVARVHAGRASRRATSKPARSAATLSATCCGRYDGSDAVDRGDERVERHEAGGRGERAEHDHRRGHDVAEVDREVGRRHLDHVVLGQRSNAPSNTVELTSTTLPAAAAGVGSE